MTDPTNPTPQYAELEVWRPLPAPYDHYEASSHGRVRSPRAILKPRINMNGYPVIGLWSHGRVKSKKVHVAVCEAFHGPRPDGMVAAHLDGTRTNSRPENLRWVTHRENNRHRHEHGTAHVGEKHPAAKLTEEDVRFILKTRLSNSKAAALFGVSRTLISKIQLRQVWKHVS